MTEFNPWYIAWGVIAFVLVETGKYLMKRWLDTHGDRLYNLLSWKTLPVFVDFVSVVVGIYFAFSLFLNSKPATKTDVLVAMGLTLLIVVSVANLADDLMRWKRAYLEAASKPS
ncbi:MAG TPA: hypothetical protein VN280_22430 [Variovorax sp.]|nr:hypothetical protein [Variovorax sp.]